MIADAPKRQCQVFLIKFADAGQAGSYSIIMGCSMTLLAINGEAVGFEQIGPALHGLIDNPARVTIAAQGSFENAIRLSLMQATASSALPEQCELYFDGGLRVRARFLIARFEFVGVRNGEAVFSVILESVGGCDVR